ncbi:MbtH family NRPS accessory protein [Streptomyces sp. TS71-3]|uniref:MbtH family NRPS accessory protein n=1 Tax=Streptomyces sp. TS71-3 TaxID=2733862 RepID=UPI001B0D762C|nr:MbtH family NRPS accessory protein [Streptomyces sp. TS71-3]GHJ35506.1 MbtH-like protein [Streptomyces sp. TS71-3]
MSGNPFDGGDGDWLVVVNAAGQHALWRPHLDLPEGWRIVYSGPDRDGALDHVEQHATATPLTPTT